MVISNFSSLRPRPPEEWTVSPLPPPRRETLYEVVFGYPAERPFPVKMTGKRASHCLVSAPWRQAQVAPGDSVGGWCVPLTWAWQCVAKESTSLPSSPWSSSSSGISLNCAVWRQRRWIQLPKDFRQWMRVHVFNICIFTYLLVWQWKRC